LPATLIIGHRRGGKSEMKFPMKSSLRRAWFARLVFIATLLVGPVAMRGDIRPAM
jgi:hypothetical protein